VVAAPDFMTALINTPQALGSSSRPTRWAAIVLGAAAALTLGGVSMLSAGGCKSAPAPAVAVSDKPFDVRDLEGDWFIVASDQPVWTSGEKASPTLQYKLVSGSSGAVELEDKVSFLENGERGEYRGRDTQASDNPAAFEWRGTGALSLVSTRWHLAHMASDKTWAIAFYEKTFATPAGVAVISRTAKLPSEAFAEARSELSNNSSLSEHASGLREVTQNAL
jgi:hypothetical protein